MKKHHPFTKIPAYRTFSHKRDAALERLLAKGRARASDVLRRFMVAVKGDVARAYPLLNTEHMDPRTNRELEHLDAQLGHHVYALSGELGRIWTVTRAQAYTLAHASEQAALLKAGVKGFPKPLSRGDILSAAYKPTSLGPADSRAHLALSRLRRKVMDAVELGRILGDTAPQAVDRALAIFPRPELLAYPSKEFRRLREAKRPTQDELAEDYPFSFVDFVDEAERDAIVSEYTDQFVPEWRDPRAGALEAPVAAGDGEGFITYPWELEREMTEDFVASVEEGRHAGAKAQGITTFVWTAIIDQKTDDCCIKRDGLTTAEIAEKLKDDWAGDECQATVTPAHFNCRCRLVPATEDLPEVPESNAPDFEEWLAA